MEPNNSSEIGDNANEQEQAPLNHNNTPTASFFLTTLRLHPRFFGFLVLSFNGIVTTVAGGITQREPLNNALIGTGVGLMSTGVGLLFWEICTHSRTQPDEQALDQGNRGLTPAV